MTLERTVRIICVFGKHITDLKKKPLPSPSCLMQVCAVVRTRALSAHPLWMSDLGHDP